MDSCLISGMLMSTRARIKSLIDDQSKLDPFQSLTTKPTDLGSLPSNWLNCPIVQNALPLPVVEDLKRLDSLILGISVASGNAEGLSGCARTEQLWLNEVKELAYCAEDVVMECGYEWFLGNGGGYSSGRLKPVLDNPNVFVYHVVISDNLVVRLREVLTKFEKVCGEHPALGYAEKPSHHVSVMTGDRHGTWMSPTTPVIFGREQEKQKIINLVRLSNTSTGHVSVLAIVGQAGFGKTALAQLVYKDPIVSRDFNLRAWVNTAEGFCITNITRNILQSFRKKECFIEDQTRLQKELVRELVGKSFLIILDGLNHENKSLWERFLAPLLYAQSGRIIITTRSVSTAKIVQTMPQFNLKELSFEDGWSMFKCISFGSLDANGQPSFLETGKRIYAKCGDIPLFVKVVASALMLENDEQKWASLSEFDLHGTSSSSEVISSPLKICYECMPVMLKRCFIFLALYPCGHVFVKDDLIRLWMSVGLLGKEHGEEKLTDAEWRSLEWMSFLKEKCSDSLEAGSLIFDELLQRAVFEPSHGVYRRNDGFLVHHLVHDFARSIAGEEFAVVKHDGLQDISTYVRFLSILVPDSSENVDLQPLKACKHLRVLQIVNQGNTWKCGGVKIDIPNELFKQFTCLRSLIIRDANLEILPDSIGNLKLLQYLDLANTRIHELPRSIQNLIYLQVLELTNCPLKELPGGINELINLQIVNFQKSFCLGLPRGIGNLSKLKTLPRFDVRRDNWHAALFELNGLVNLSGELTIAGLGNLTNDHEAKEINLQNKKDIRALTLDWSTEPSPSTKLGSTSTLTNFDEDVLQSLQPHTNLRELQIHNYGGSKFPSWLSDSSFTSLVKLTLIDCNKGQVLPTLGQLPYLKNLSIRSLSNLRFVRHEFCSNDDTIKGFQTLEKLEFFDMVKWSQWTGVNEGEFCSLGSLKLVECPLLMLIPEWLCSSLVKLVIKDCGMLLSLPDLPSVRTVSFSGNINQEIFRCLDMPFLTELKFSNLRNIRTIPLNHVKLPRLQRLEIHGCRKVESVCGINCLSSLMFFDISACQNLQFSLNEELPEALIHLGISRCPKLISWKRSHEIKYFNQLHMHGDIKIEGPELELPGSSQAKVGSQNFCDE